jgi:ABC-type glutathione transport system ATPase component
MQALAGVSFEITPGEVMGLMGESGCGKTTLAMAILGVLPRESAKVSGSIRFRGGEMLAMREKRLREIRGSGISMIYQEPELALSPFLCAGDQVAEVIQAHRDCNWTQCRDAALAAIERMGFEEPERIYGSYLHQLSGGQRQRIVFAQALACEPALIVADEPTASLDARTQAEVIELLHDIKSQRQVSILLISHTPEIQASLSDRLIVMSQGQIIEHGSFDQLYWNPARAVTKMLLHASDDSHARQRDVSDQVAAPAPIAHEEFVR